MITENLSTLKIHKLTQAQYDRELAAGNIDANALYLTPDEESDLSEYATIEQLDNKADKQHGHNIEDVTDLQLVLDTKQATITGGASTIVSNNLTENRVLVSDNSGKVDVGNVTSSELEYLTGVTSNVQAQLDEINDDLVDVVYAEENDSESATTPLNADTLGGRLPSEFALAENLTFTADSLQTQIDGKAPAGYGLGGVAPTIWSGSVKDITKSGWYWCEKSLVSDLPHSQGVLLASVGPYHTRLDFYILHGIEYSGCHAVLIKNWDTWGEWEWENPPMVLGVEYRTTERWQGKAVYTKLIDCGKMPNNTQVAIPHRISMDKVIRHCGYGGSSTIPYSTTVWTPTATTHSVDVEVSTYAIYIRTNYDTSAESAMIQIWYTKD